MGPHGEHDDNDTAMAINRNLFEILINVIAYTNNPSLFKEKILPISKVNNGTYEYLRNKEGYVSKNKIVNIKTKEVINIQITTAELSKKAGNLYKDLYDNLFNELSFYVHLNVNSISKFFDEPDPFYEIDPIAISSLLGMFFVVESIYYIAKSSEIDNLLYRDMIYISDDIKSQMKPIIEVILEIENYKNPVYRILDKIISNYELIK